MRDINNRCLFPRCLVGSHPRHHLRHQKCTGLEGVDPQDADLAAENARLKQLLEDLRAERVRVPELSAHARVTHALQVDPGDDATAALQHRLQEVLEQSAEKDELLRKATKVRCALGNALQAHTMIIMTGARHVASQAGHAAVQHGSRACRARRSSAHTSVG